MTIVARGASGGHTRAEGLVSSAPTLAALEQGVVVPLLAGRAAEEHILGAPSVGSQSDLARATLVLAEAHAGQGLGSRLISRGDPATILAYDRELRDVVEADLQRLYPRALDTIRRRRGAVQTIADALLEKRFLTADDIAVLVTLPRARTSSSKARGKKQ